MTTSVVELITQPPAVVELVRGLRTVIEVLSEDAAVVDVIKAPRSVFEVLEQAPATVEITTETGAVFEVLSTGPRGPQGDRGEAGAVGETGPPVDTASLSFSYTQNTPSVLWTIIHSLGFIPAGLLVVGADGQHHDPQIVTSTRQATVLSFLTPVSGNATLS